LVRGNRVAISVRNSRIHVLQDVGYPEKPAAYPAHITLSRDRTFHASPSKRKLYPLLAEISANA